MIQPGTSVAQEDLSAPEMVLADFEAGVITVDQYVEYGLWSLHRPDAAAAVRRRVAVLRAQLHWGRNRISFVPGSGQRWHS